MKRILNKNEFNPNGVGLKNGNFIGLPFDETSANVVLVGIPWDVTVSYREGTALAPQAILDASVQLDLYDADVKDAWKLGIYMRPIEKSMLGIRNIIRPRASAYIDFLEKGGVVETDKGMVKILNEINSHCQNVSEWIREHCAELLEAGKMVGLIGGDHSVPFGFLQALSEKYGDFGVLHIDAHHDLRQSYEGFTWSHASVFYNALRIKEISKLVQVSIRDFCEEEVQMVSMQAGRIEVFYDQQLKESRFKGMNWNGQCDQIISHLPQNVYISFDIDGLSPVFCPSTGTPVPGGLEFDEAVFLLKKVVESGRKIIGFDLVEVGNNEWDANVGARLVYKMCNLMGQSSGKI